MCRESYNCNFQHPFFWGWVTVIALAARPRPERQRGSARPHNPPCSTSPLSLGRPPVQSSLTSVVGPTVFRGSILSHRRPFPRDADHRREARLAAGAGLNSRSGHPQFPTAVERLRHHSYACNVYYHV